MNSELLCIVFLALASLHHHNSSIVPETQVINDTALVTIDYNGVYINNDTAYVMDLFTKSQNATILTAFYNQKLELLNNLTSLFISDSNSQKVAFENQFTQALLSAQAANNPALIQNAVNVFQSQWSSNAQWLSSSLKIINYALSNQTAQYNTDLNTLRQNFFSNYFG